MIAAGVNTWKKLPGTGTTPQAGTTTTTTTGTTKPVTQPKPAPMGQSGIRQYLLDNGIGNDQIGYNKANNSVTVGGQSFITPATVQGGTSYATKDALDQAFAGYQNKQTYNKANDLLKTIESDIKTGYTPGTFSFDYQSDPQYIAQLQAARNNITYNSGNALAELNKRGVALGGIGLDRVAAIQSDENNRLNYEILPQLYSQAYERFQDGENRRYQTSRDKMSDTASLLSSILGVNNERQADDQQAWENRFNYGNAIGVFGNGQKTLAAKGQEFDQNMATKQYDRGVLESDRNYNRGVLESDRNYKQGVLESDRSYGLAKDDNARQWASYNLSKSNSEADNGRANSNASYGRLMDIWQATGKAPAGLESYGVQPGTPYGQQQSAEYSYSSDPDFADDMGMLMKNPTTALSEIQNNAQAIIGKYGYDGYQEFLKQAQLITPKTDDFAN